MRYLIYGSGAVGSYLGARLGLSGFPVAFLDRPQVTERLASQGLRLVGDDPGGHLRPVSVTQSLRDVESPEVIILCVKAYDAARAADEIAAADLQSIPVVCVLNGIGNEQTLGERLGMENVIAASLTTALRPLSPGVVQVERRRGLAIGAQHPLSAQIADELELSGIRMGRCPDPAAMKWSKLLTNIVANASSAILGWTAGQVFEHPGMFRLEIESLRETVRVMRRMGLPVIDLPGVPVRLLAAAVFLPPQLTRRLLARQVAGGRGDKLPSFSYDLASGRSEVGWLNGATWAHGERLGVPTPANQVLTETLSALVEGRLDPSAYRNQPQRLLQSAFEFGVASVRGYNQRDQNQESTA